MSSPASPRSAGSARLSEGPSRPLLHVVRGTPDDAELAALAVVIASLGRPAASPGRRRQSWADRGELTRRPATAASGGWRASALPR